MRTELHIVVAVAVAAAAVLVGAVLNFGIGVLLRRAILSPIKDEDEYEIDETRRPRRWEREEEEEEEGIESAAAIAKLVLRSI